jgi:hypothetical protein
MPNIEFVNERLQYYLDSKEYRYTQCNSLIAAIIKDDSNIKAKYDLYCLLMNTGTDQLVINNLTSRLESIYRSDVNINAYLDHCVRYNPKMGEVTIEAYHRRDMKDDCSKYIRIVCKQENANHIIDTAKEVLTMMLMESKTIPNE